MLPIFGPTAEETDLKSLLREIEEFKSWRNALAHGLDVSPSNETSHITIEVISRSGNKKTIDITPESHESRLKYAEELLSKV